MTENNLDSKQFNLVEYSEKFSTTSQIKKYILDLIGQDSKLNVAKILQVINTKTIKILAKIGYFNNFQILDECNEPVDSTYN